MTSTGAKAPAGRFTVKQRKSDGKWLVYEDGKFRRPFDTKTEAEQFVAAQDTPRKGKP